MNSRLAASRRQKPPDCYEFLTIIAGCFILAVGFRLFIDANGIMAEEWVDSHLNHAELKATVTRPCLLKTSSPVKVTSGGKPVATKHERGVAIFAAEAGSH